MDDLSNMHSLAHLGLDPGHPLSADGVILGHLNPLHTELDLSGNMMDFILATDTVPTTSTSEYASSSSHHSHANAVLNTILNGDPLSAVVNDHAAFNLTSHHHHGGLSIGANNMDAVSDQGIEEEPETVIPVDELVQKPQARISLEAEADASIEVAETVRGQAVQLEDGTTALVEEVSKDGLHAVHLQDGSIAYITVSAYAQLFSGTEYTGPPLSMVTQQQAVMDGGDIDSSPLSVNKPARLKSGDTTPNKPFRCDVEGCRKAYSTQCHLKVHTRSHSGDRPFVCQYLLCQKQFTTSYALKAHIRTHTGEKPYICPNEECRKGFRTSGDLGKHIRTHTGERPFKCPFEGCDRSFTTSNIRKVHIRVHTGEKPFSCDLTDCDKTFSSQTNYKNHMRMHRGEKPYICTIPGCEKRFTEYSSLYKHHATHSKVKSYMYCGFCGKAYRQTSTLTMHIRTAHSMFATAKNRLVVASSGAELNPSADMMKPKALNNNFTLRINEPVAQENNSMEMKMAVIDDPTLRNLIGKLTSDQIDKTRLGMTIPEGSQIAPIALQITGDHSLGPLYLVTDPTQLRILKNLLSRDLNNANQSRTSLMSSHHPDSHSMSSSLLGPVSILKDDKSAPIGSDSVTSLDAESNDLIGQLIGNADVCTLSSPEIFSLVSTS